jgi:alkaline phosphatase
VAGREASNPWFDLGWQSWMLGIEASTVIAMRMASVARGGAEAEREIELMVNEKIEAGHQLQAKLSSLGGGAAPATAMVTALKHYRGKVAANRRRLSR